MFCRRLRHQLLRKLDFCRARKIKKSYLIRSQIYFLLLRRWYLSLPNHTEKSRQRIIAQMCQKNIFDRDNSWFNIPLWGQRYKTFLEISQKLRDLEEFFLMPGLHEIARQFYFPAKYTLKLLFGFKMAYFVV